MADNTVEFIVKVKGENVTLVQKQTDKLAKSTDKAGASSEKLTKKQDKYNRLQKGTAQMGMNTTKSFSKMQQSVDGGGSGGLVRAYALLAANVFALTAAFGVLSRSAQIDTLTQSMEILSTTGGTYIKNLAKEMQAASGYAIDLAQAFSQVSLASSAGLSTKEIEGLTKVAKGAAISLGRNLPDAMDRIFRGAIKLEPEILDEIGLFVRVDEAAQKYARDNNKVVSSLSQVEKRQAFLNEILDQGSKKFSEYADTIKPDPYVRLEAALGDIAQSGLSFLNSFLGPLLGFLAQSKTLLTAVFGALVLVLLKKALPAMGLMTKGAAELAQERAKAAKDYSKSITETSDKAIAAEMKTDKAARKALKEKQKAQKRFVSRAGTQPDMAKFDKAQLGSLKRKTLLEERISVLKKAQNESGSKNQTLIKAELAMLKKEQQIEEKLAKLRAKGGVKAGSLAERRQEKLDSKARVQTVVAGAAGTMETQGISAGWRELNEELKAGEKLADGNRRAFSGTEKAMARFKGGVSTAGIAMNKAMMIMGPWMAAFAMLSPFLIAFGKWLGLSSVEAGKFDESLKKLADASENLHKRFKTQTDQMISGKLTFYEHSKAALAFNKGMLEASRGTQEMYEQLDTFQKEATDSALAWEKFKGLFGLDRESKALAQQLATVKKQIEGLVRASGVEGAEAFYNIQGAKEFADQVVIAQQAELAFTAQRDARREAGEPLLIRESKALEDYQKRLQEWQKNPFTTITGSMDGMTMTTIVKTDEPLFDNTELELSEGMIDAARNEAIELGILEKVMGLIAGTRQQMSDSQRVMGDSTEEETKRLGILTSNMEGAHESLGKFVQGFQIKTKADDLNNSLSGMNDSINGVKNALKDQKKKGEYSILPMTDKELNDFFTKMEKDSDNAFSKIFSPEQIKEFKEGNTTAWDEMVEGVKKYQHRVIVTKNEQAQLTKQTKTMAGLSKAGLVFNTARFKKEGEIKRKGADFLSDEHDLVLATNRLENGRFKIGLDIINSKKTQVQIEEALKNEGMTREGVMAAQQSHLAKMTAEYEAQLAEQTKLLNAQIETTKIALQEVEAKKKLNKALQTQARLTAELQAISGRGTTTLTPAKELELKIKVALDNFKITKMEVELKMKMLDYELAVQKIKLKILRDTLDADDPLRAKIGMMEGEDYHAGGDTGMFAMLNKASETAGKALKTQLANLGPQLQVTLAGLVQGGFSEGMATGILDSAAVLKANLKQLTDSEEYKKMSAEEKTAAEGKVRGDVNKLNMRASLESTANLMKEMGPEGEFASVVISGALAIGDAYENMQTQIANGAETSAAKAAMAAQTLGAIGQMMAANSKRQIAAVDSQIAAEKKRDGKSKESLAKIKALEAKKEAMKKKAFERDKKMKMAQVIASTASAVIQSFANMGGYPTGIPAAAAMAVLGALQLAVIAKTKYEGGSSNIEKPAMTALSIGKRTEKVDVSRGASGGELGYLRGQRGTGGPQNFVPTGGAAGLLRNYANGGILVGERGPEVIAPRGSYEVTPNDALGGSAGNVNFTINAVDAAGVEEVLVNNRGYIINMIRQAANDAGEGFLETIDTDVVSGGG